jgi:U3 small nucleolar ribonucleoprotein protein IMP4
LIFEGFSTPLGERVVTILKHLFPPREAGRGKEGNRVITFALTDGDYISVRHHVYVRTGYKSVELAEVGPRMEMKVCSNAHQSICRRAMGDTGRLALTVIL